LKIKICIEPGCKNAQTTKDYCRLHYLRNWKKIKEANQKKAVDRLNKYVEGICKKYPDRYVEVIRREMKTGTGDYQKATDEAFEEANSDDIMSWGCFQDDDGIDKLLSQIKIDKDF